MLSGKTCHNYGLPMQVSQIHTLNFDDIVDHPESRSIEDHIDDLNDQQRTIVEAVFTAAGEVMSDCPPKCRAFFVDGPGGSGKTTVYNSIIMAMKNQHLQVCCL